MNKADCTILIPTLNEEETIETVIKNWREYEFDNILVVDGHSTDKTVEIAKSMGADVLTQTGKGKGNAVVEGIRTIRTKYCIMVDGDNTYPAYYGTFILQELEYGIKHVIGNRLMEYDKGAFKRLNFIGNKLFTWLFSLKWKKDLRDVLSGYRGFLVSTMEDLHCEGFEIEIEMCKLVVKNKIKVNAIPIHYRARTNKKSTKLHPVKDGWIILKHLFSN